MTCPTPFIDAGVAERQQLSALALHLDSMAPASGPAATTETPLSNGARAAMIVRRASRLRFPNEIQRQRYIQRHSQACSGDA